MKKEKWHEDQPILKADLDREQAAREETLSERMGDEVTFGVVRDSQLLGESSEFLIEQGPSAGLYVTVNTGVAYSSEGERIVIPSVDTFDPTNVSLLTDNGIGGTVLTPQSSGSQNIPVTDNATNRIWVGYLETVDTRVFALSAATNARLFVKRNDGFEIQVTTNAVNPDASRFVLLGEVVTSGGSVTSISTSNTAEAQSVGPVNIPGSPYQITLTTFPNLPEELDRPSSIPTIAGFTYVVGAPAASQFTVNFSTGIVTFNSADVGTSVTINYLTQYTRRAFCVTKKNKVGAHLSVNTGASTYSVGTAVTLTEHVNARGSGVISPTNPHGLAANDLGLAGVLDLGGKLASSGIITSSGDASSLISALSPSAVSAFSIPDNKVTIAPLVSGESVNVSGALIVNTDIPTLLTFDFIDPNTLLPLAAATYYFYVDAISKTVERGTSIPSGGFPVASIVWDGSKLLLPITDLRVFGTTSKANLRLETLLGLVTGAATDNRLSTIYNAKLVGTTIATAPNYTFAALGGTTLNVTVDGTPDSVTFPAIPANTTINGVVSAITSQIAGVKAVKTSTNQVKLLASMSLVITGGTAAPILGFPVSPAAGSSDTDGNIKEIRVSGSSSTVGTAGESIDAEISFTYDLTPEQKLTQVDARIGNKNLSTVLTYNADNSVKTVQEIVI